MATTDFPNFVKEHFRRAPDVEEAYQATLKARDEAMGIEADKVFYYDGPLDADTLNSFAWFDVANPWTLMEDPRPSDLISKYTPLRNARRMTGWPCKFIICYSEGPFAACFCVPPEHLVGCPAYVGDADYAVLRAR